MTALIPMGSTGAGDDDSCRCDNNHPVVSAPYVLLRPPRSALECISRGAKSILLVGCADLGDGLVRREKAAIGVEGGMTPLGTRDARSVGLSAPSRKKQYKTPEHVGKLAQMLEAGRHLTVALSIHATRVSNL